LQRGLVVDRRLLARLSMTPAQVLEHLAASLSGEVRGDTLFWSGMFAAVQSTPVGIADDARRRYGIRPTVTVTFRRLPDGPERSALDDEAYTAANVSDLGDALRAVVELLAADGGDAVLLATDGTDSVLLEHRHGTLHMSDGPGVVPAQASGRLS
jgi:hypothetical protein